MKIIETKGEVQFFEDDQGEIFQQLGEHGNILKVADGKIINREIKQLNGCKIRYNTNGVYGYSVWVDDNCLEDRIWTLKEAEEIAKGM